MLTRRPSLTTSVSGDLQSLCIHQCNGVTSRAVCVVSQVSFLEGSDVYFATALAFLRLHEAEILLGEDIADVVSAREIWSGEVGKFWSVPCVRGDNGCETIKKIKSRRHPNTER